MPSEFLQKRYPRALAEWSGQTTVRYFAFVADSADPVTGDVTEATAYDSNGVFLPALIDLSPSERMRDRLGLDQDFVAALQIPNDELDKYKITISQGDKFELPGESASYYVLKVVPSKQVGDKFITRLVALSHKVGRR